MRIPIVIILFFLNCIPQSAESQIEHFYETWRWSHFTAASGLPSDVVEDIIENKNGVIWASTLSGIAWYDGYRWNKVHGSQGLPEKHVTQTSAWKNNTLLVIVDGKLYAGDTLKFSQISLGPTYNCNVLSMAPIDSESIVILTDDVQYPYLFISNQKIKPIQLSSTGRLFNTKNNDIYLAHAFGLYQIKDVQTHKILTGCFIRTIADNTSQQKVMIVDAPHDMIGIWEWNKNGYPRLSKTERLLPVRTIDISSKGNVVAVYETGNVHVRSNNQWSPLYPVPQQMIGAIFVKFDSKDNMWVGTGKGLYLYKNQPTKWKWLKQDYFDLRNIVMEIFRDNKNNIWVGNSNGLTVYIRKW
jgi:ligand-binding sensor domain-containing protein